jgi:cyclase
MQHIADVLTTGAADAALAASVFHYKTIEIPILKKFLTDQKIAVKL